MALLDDAGWHSKIFLGEWIKGGAGDAPVIEPATGDELGRTGRASVDDVAAASSRGAVAQREWASLPYSARAAVLRKAGDLFTQHGDEIADWIVRESGGIGPKAGLEVHTAADGASALAFLGQQFTPIVITDLNMPVMDGLALWRATTACRAARQPT